LIEAFDAWQASEQDRADRLAVIEKLDAALKRMQSNGWVGRRLLSGLKRWLRVKLRPTA
jgi:hypothetical protein